MRLAVFITLSLLFSAASQAKSKSLTLTEKRIHLSRALKTANSMIEKALANPKYAGVARPSSQSRGPKDIRKVLEYFQIDMSLDIASTPLKYDSSGYWSIVCAKSETLGGVVRGTTQIYMCNPVFDRDDAGIAEVLIHEYTHSLGYNRDKQDECSATEVAFHAALASGLTPHGDDYSNGTKDCTKMIKATAQLAIALRDPSDLPTTIKAGAKVVFTENLGAQVTKDLLETGMYWRTGPNGQDIEIDADSKTKRAPREPLIVKSNDSLADRIDIRLTDADGFNYRFIAMGNSQISLPLSALKKHGISFVE